MDTRPLSASDREKLITDCNLDVEATRVGGITTLATIAAGNRRRAARAEARSLGIDWARPKASSPMLPARRAATKSATQVPPKSVQSEIAAAVTAERKRWTAVLTMDGAAERLDSAVSLLNRNDRVADIRSALAALPTDAEIRRRKEVESSKASLSIWDRAIKANFGSAAR